MPNKQITIVIEEQTRGFFTADVNGVRKGWGYSLAELMESLADQANELEFEEKQDAH
jgi:hypothetical protein